MSPLQSRGLSFILLLGHYVEPTAYLTEILTITEIHRHHDDRRRRCSNRRRLDTIFSPDEAKRNREL